jgi:hypothetical protein
VCAGDFDDRADRLVLVFSHVQCMTALGVCARTMPQIVAALSIVRDSAVHSFFFISTKKHKGR